MRTYLLYRLIIVSLFVLGAASVIIGTFVHSSDNFSYDLSYLKMIGFTFVAIGLFLLPIIKKKDMLEKNERPLVSTSKRDKFVLFISLVISALVTFLLIATSS